MSLRLRASLLALPLTIAVVEIALGCVARAASLGPAASQVFGQLDFVHNGVNILDNGGLSNPRAVAVDRSVTPNRLYVVDLGNHRVLGWRSIQGLVNGSLADLVIGQADFLSWSSQCNNAAVTGATLCDPTSAAVDGSGNLYVVDAGNNRVLEYDKPFTTDTQPDRVFGQGGSFTASACNQDGSITAATLCNPTGVAVDTAGALYIADADNSRVLGFDRPLVTPLANRVFGQNGRFTTGTCNAGGVSANTLCAPAVIAVDRADNLYVEDNGNFRLLEYDDPLRGNTTANLVFGQGNFDSSNNSCASGPSRGSVCAPSGLALDSADNLYASDGTFSRIQEYADPVASGITTPAAVFGQPNFVSGLCNNGALGPGSLCLPFGMATDAAGDLFVADFGNQRVLEYLQPLSTRKPNTNAGLVLGQTTFQLNGINRPKPNSLYWPGAVALDFSVVPHRLYIADTSNSRVLGWRSIPSFANGAPADLVIGQAGSLSAGCNQNQTDGAGNSLAAADTLCQPGGVTVDSSGNLYVADSSNYRVLEYNAPFSTGKSANLVAAIVFGQNGSFTSRVVNNGGVSAASMAAPGGVAVDKASRLYVADPANNRVLEYNHPSTRDTTADAVFGQGGSLTSSACNFDGLCDRTGCFSSADSLCNPTAVAVDDAGSLYIADTANNRALVFNNPQAAAKAADLVIGQTDFKGLDCNGLCAPQGLAVSPAGILFAADSANSAVNQYNAPLRSGMAPNQVIGREQCGQTSTTASTLCGVSGLAFAPPGILYASDTFDNRVVAFDLASTPTPTASAPATSTPSASPTQTPSATPTPIPGHPSISSIPDVILVGGVFTLEGAGFTLGSRINFFVATGSGPINTGPLTPISFAPGLLTVAVPAGNPLGQGVVSVQVVNTDRDFLTSNALLALLQGNPAAGIPSITGIDSVPLAADSADPDIAVANVETVVVQGQQVTIEGTGFDTTYGVAVDLFCDCPGEKVGPFFLNPGNPGLTSTRIALNLPASGPGAPSTGPGSFVVSNQGADGSFGRKSNAVAVPIGQRLTVTSVQQIGTTVTVDGSGFSTLTVINFFNEQAGVVVNLGGLKSDRTPRIPLALINQTEFTFSLPGAAVAGAGYIQAVSPPFVPFSSSGNGLGGSFTVR